MCALSLSCFASQTFVDDELINSITRIIQFRFQVFAKIFKY
jgi:hypothetical protein